MKFLPVTDMEIDVETLTADYKTAHEIGVIRLGKENLFFRKGLKHFVIPYAVITKMYRRVFLVQASVCCGKGDIAVENLVVCSEKGEIAQIALPGTKAAKALMEELKTLLPGVDFRSPKQEKAEEQ